MPKFGTKGENMKVVYHDQDNNKPLYVLLGGAAIVVVIVAIILFAVVHHKVKETGEEETETSAPTEVVVETEEVVTETEKLDMSTENDNAEFPIENQEEYIEPILGFYSEKVNEAVKGFIFQNNISANAAVCLDCAVALDDSSCTEFYLQLNDPSGTIVTARYNPNTTGVTVSNCVYSLEEIKEESWMSDNGPAIRDSAGSPADTTGGIQGTLGQTSQGNLSSGSTTDHTIPGEDISSGDSSEGESIPNLGTDSTEIIFN